MASVMSGGYDVGDCKVLSEKGDTVIGEDFKRLLCVFCKMLLRDAHQLSCGDRACKHCLPSEIFTCPDPSCGIAGINPSPKICFPDRSCQKNMKLLRVLCQCTDKIDLKDWEEHCESCPRMRREQTEEHSPQERDLFPDGKSVETAFQPPQTELGAIQQPILRNPNQTFEPRINLNDILKPTPKNESLTLSGNPLSTPQDGSLASLVPKSEMVLPQIAAIPEEAPIDCEKYFDPKCKPKVLAIVNANDSSCTNGKPSATAVASMTSNEPQLNAIETEKLLVPILSDCGFCVIPVINKSKNCLFELLGNIKTKLPDSIELVIFISTTHGQCGKIFMNEESVKITEILQNLMEINGQYFFTVFEGCQSGPGSLHIERADRPYSVVYSVPPQATSYHYNSIGILTRCLAKLLKGPYRKSLKDLGNDLRHELKKFFENEKYKNEEPSIIVEEPIIVENRSSAAINFNEKISKALKPQVTNVSRNGVWISFDVAAPQRLIFHPSGEKFELEELFVAITDGGVTKNILIRDTIEFGAKWSVPLKLTPRAEKTAEVLEVVAVYKDGRTESSGPLDCELPVYDPPRIVSCERNNCKVDITFIANQEFTTESGEYQVSSIQWRCGSHGDWAPLEGALPSDGEQTCSVPAPHCHPGGPSVSKVQIRKCYDSTSTNLESNSMDLTELPTVGWPEVIHIGRHYSKKTVKFEVNNCCCPLEISRCGVKYWKNLDEDTEYCDPPDCGEVEVEIPIEAIRLQAVVEYDNIGIVLGRELDHKNSSCQQHVYTIKSCYSKNKCAIRCLLLWLIKVIVLTLILSLSLACIFVYPTYSNTEVIVSNTTIDPVSLKPNMLKSLLYKEIQVALNNGTVSDNVNINVSIFETFNAMKHQGVKINFANPLHISGDGKQCQYLDNEYGNPTYYLEGSNITGSVRIYLPSTSDELHSAVLLGVTSYYEDVEDRCFDMKKLKPIFTLMNVSSANRNKPIKLQTCTVPSNTYVYLMMQTDASSSVTVGLNLSLDVLYYPGLKDMPVDSYKIIGNVSLSHTASIPIKFGKAATYYAFAHDIGEDPRRIVHLDLTVVRRIIFEGSTMAIVASLIIGPLVLLCFCCLHRKMQRNEHRLPSKAGTDYQVIINRDPKDILDAEERKPLMENRT